MNKALVDRAPVSDFVVHHLMVDIPADEDTGEEGAQRQTAVGREPVEGVEQRHSEGPVEWGRTRNIQENG